MLGRSCKLCRAVVPVLVSVPVLALALLVVPCKAPVGMQFAGASESSSSSSSRAQGGSKAAGAAKLGAAAAAASLSVIALRRSFTPGGSPAWQSSAGSPASSSKEALGIEPGAVPFGGLDDFDSSDDELEDYDAEQCISCDDTDDEGDVQASTVKGSSSAGKLWSSAQFPEGTTGAQNYDAANLKAAQDWSCPCPDRRNCIGQERLPNIFELYEHRKRFRTTAQTRGGLRDANRTELNQHYSSASKQFTRSFVVGPLGDCCAASAGLANGLSFATWASSRADVTKERPWHAGRCEQKSKHDGVERAHLEAYIRDVRRGLEGPKGGSDPISKWSIEKASLSKRWAAYHGGTCSNGAQRRPS